MKSSKSLVSSTSFIFLCLLTLLTTTDTSLEEKPIDQAVSSKEEATLSANPLTVSALTNETQEDEVRSKPRRPKGKGKGNGRHPKGKGKGKKPCKSGKCAKEEGVDPVYPEGVYARSNFQPCASDAPELSWMHYLCHGGKTKDENHCLVYNGSDPGPKNIVVDNQKPGNLLYFDCTEKEPLHNKAEGQCKVTKDSVCVELCPTANRTPYFCKRVKDGKDRVCVCEYKGDTYLEPSMELEPLPEVNSSDQDFMAAASGKPVGGGLGKPESDSSGKPILNQILSKLV